MHAAPSEAWNDPLWRRRAVLAALGGLTGVTLAGCGGGGGSSASPSPAPGSGGTPSSDFHTGGDISLLSLMEAQGQVYRAGGQAEDLLATFSSHGCTLMRLRLWVNPSGSDIFVNDLAYTVALAQRIQAAGLTWLLDIHYSDTWADPGAQAIPAAWAGLSLSALAAQVRAYTAQVIATLRDAGAMPAIVQIGNETTDGMLWPTGQISKAGWGPYATLVKAGIAGVGDGTGSAAAPKIMLHIDRGGDWGATQWFFDNVATQGIAYDLIGLSFYPHYHGPLSSAKTVLTNTAARYDKGVMVVETGYPFEGSWSGAWVTYPVTPAGQRQFLIDLVAHVRTLPNGRGRGVLFWAPEWLPVAGLGSGWGEKTLYADNGAVLPGLAALGGLLDPALSYRIVNRASGMALDVQAASTVSGAQIMQTTIGSATSQRWAVTGTSAGFFSLTVRHSGLLLDSSAGGEGAALMQAAASGSVAQQWDVVDAGVGCFRIVQRANGLVLDTDASLADGAPVRLRAAVDALPQQQWSLVAAN